VIKKKSLLAVLSSFLLLATTALDSGILRAQQLMLNTSDSQILATTINENDPYKSRFFRVRGAPRITVNTVSGGVEVYENEALE